MASLQLTVNGHEHHVDAPSGTSLLEVLRNDIGDSHRSSAAGSASAERASAASDAQP